MMFKKIVSSKTFRTLGAYFVIVLISALLLNLFIRSYTKANYTDLKREELLSSYSKFRYYGDNPCTNAIFGSPDASIEYIKVNIYCPDGSYSTNTLALQAVHPKTYAGAVKLVAKMNLYEAVILPEGIVQLGNIISDSHRWKCFIDSVEITDFEKDIRHKDNINCYYRAL